MRLLRRHRQIIASLGCLLPFLLSLLPLRASALPTDRLRIAAESQSFMGFS